MTGKEIEVMSKRILTIIDTESQMIEIDLDHYQKKELRMGRSSEVCDIVIPDVIVSRSNRCFSSATPTNVPFLLSRSL